MTRRLYSNTATEATLTASIAAADTSFTLTSFAGYPAVPFTATISRGGADEEVILVTAVATSTVTATRGYDGTTAKSHSAGATVVHTTIAKDFDEANAHVNATTGVHGATGAVVGTTDTQTLTNKTLTSPTLQTPTATGTSTLAAAAFSGAVTFATTVQVTGVSTLGVVNATSASLSATLAVTGVTTLTGALAANGGLTVPTGKKATITDAPTLGTDGVNKTYADARETAAKAYTDTRETAIKAYADAQDAAFLAALPHAQLRQTVAQSSLAATYADITFTTEDYDSHGGHDNVTNPNRWTCPASQGGVYAVEGIVSANNPGGGAAAVFARLLKNGTTVPASYGPAGTYASGGTLIGGTGRVLVTLAPGDWIGLQGWLTTGAVWGTQAVAGENQSRLTVERLR